MLLLLACTAPVPDETASSFCTSGACEPRYGVIDQLPYAEPDKTGMSIGLDLDGEVSTAGGSSGCGHADFVDPDGREGIDNGFSTLLPLLESTEAVALEGLIQDAINAGGLLLIYELEGVDSLENDPEVDLTVWHGAGEPLLGTDGYLEWGQTFAKDEKLAPATAKGLSIVDGRVVGTGLEIQIALTVLNANVDLHFLDGGFSLEFQEDGTATGFLTGGVHLDDILAIAKTAGIDETLRGALISLLDYSADLYPGDGGECEGISMVFGHRAVPAWFYPGE